MSANSEAWRKIAYEAFCAWNDDRDGRCGKLLHAMASPEYAKQYRADIFALHERDCPGCGGLGFREGYGADGSPDCWNCEICEGAGVASVSPDALRELLAADRAFDHAMQRKIQADNRIVQGDRSDDAFVKQASADHSYARAVDARRAALAKVGAP